MTLEQVIKAQEGKYKQLVEERKSDYRIIADGCSPEMAKAILKRIEDTTAMMEKIQYSLDCLYMINE